MEVNDSSLEISKSDRLIWLDGIRGFALLGILLMNIQTFISAKYYYGGVDESSEASRFDHVAEWFLDLFVIGKFYPIFSILFGISFALVLEKLKEKGQKEAIFYRRLIYLALFGLIHLLFIWRGDILLTYALTGFLLMLFRNRSLPFIRRFAVVLFVIGNSLFAFLTMVGKFMMSIDQDLYQKQLIMIERVDFFYQTSSYLDLSYFRFKEELFATLFNSVFAVVMILPLFLFGYYFTKKIMIHALHKYIDDLQDLWKRSLVISVLLTIIFIVAKGEVLPIHPILSFGLMEWVRPFVGLSVAIFYLTSFVLLYVKTKIKKLAIFRYPGRMSLTNYLLQSIICSFIFYGYGLGLYGYVGAAKALFIAVIIYVGLAILSFYWLKVFQYGPFEWLWRTLTFHQRQPMRKM